MIISNKKQAFRNLDKYDAKKKLLELFGCDQTKIDDEEMVKKIPKLFSFENHEYTHSDTYNSVYVRHFYHYQQ